MNANSFNALEFERILVLLQQHAGSAEGIARLSALRPLADPPAVREALARTTEAVALLRAVGRQPYHDLPDPAEALRCARMRGAHLEPRVLTDLASFIEGGVEVAQRVARVEGTKRLTRLASEVRDTRDVASAGPPCAAPVG